MVGQRMDVEFLTRDGEVGGSGAPSPPSERRNVSRWGTMRAWTKANCRRAPAPSRGEQPPVPGCSVPGPAPDRERQNPHWRGRQGIRPRPGDPRGWAGMAVPRLLLSHVKVTRMEVLGGTEVWWMRATPASASQWRSGLKVPGRQPKRGRLWFHDGSRCGAGLRSGGADLTEQGLSEGVDVA